MHLHATKPLILQHLSEWARPLDLDSTMNTRLTCTNFVMVSTAGIMFNYIYIKA